MEWRVRIVAYTLVAVVILLLALPQFVGYIVVRNDEIEIIDQIQVTDKRGYVAATRSPASMSSYGGYQVIYASDDLKKRGYVSSISDTLVMSMKDISVTQDGRKNTSRPKLVYLNGCYIFVVSDVATPERFEESIWGRFLGTETLYLKNADRWEQTISGKRICFGLDLT